MTTRKLSIACNDHGMRSPPTFQVQTPNKDSGPPQPGNNPGIATRRPPDSAPPNQNTILGFRAAIGWDQCLKPQLPRHALPPPPGNRGQGVGGGGQGRLSVAAVPAT